MGTGGIEPKLNMELEGIEPSSFGLEPKILSPLNYSSFIK